jgi:hypothetical protein
MKRRRSVSSRLTADNRRSVAAVSAMAAHNLSGGGYNDDLEYNAMKNHHSFSNRSASIFDKDTKEGAEDAKQVLMAFPA